MFDWLEFMYCLFREFTVYYAKRLLNLRFRKETLTSYADRELFPLSFYRTREKYQGLLFLILLNHVKELQKANYNIIQSLYRDFIIYQRNLSKRRGNF